MTPDTALANCQPIPPSDGGTVTCQSFENSSINITGPLDSLTINILSGASFNTPPFSVSNIGTLTVNSAGNLPGAPGVVFTNIDILNFTLTGGNINGPLTITSNGTVNINNLAAPIDGLITFNGDADYTFTNAAFLNNGISITGNGTTSITNKAGGFINNRIQSTGNSSDTIDNSGTIQGLFDLGPGTDSVIQRAGSINAQVILGDGNDTFQMLGGTVNGSVVGGPGDDQFTIAGGNITGTVFGDGTVPDITDGNDSLLWTAGTVGAIDMGGGTDLAVLRNLSSSDLRSTVVSGGPGAGDTLTLEGTNANQPNRFTLWEEVNLTKNSSLTMGPNLTLGDSGTGTGTLNIEAGSTLFAGGGDFSVLPFTPGQLVQVNNGGRIDLTNGSAADDFTIVGNYTGQDGTVALDTVLNGDGSPSDRLVIDSGNGSGLSLLEIHNAGGLGDITTGDGIQVVTVANGGTTAGGAFALGAPVVAGPYQYLLAQGSRDGSAPNDWYLRNVYDCTTVPDAPECSTSPPGGGGTPPGGGGEPGPPPGGGPDGPGGGGGGGFGGDGSGPDGGGVGTPIYRREVSLYEALPSLSVLYGYRLLDTLHERVGEEEDLKDRTGLGNDQYANGAWARIIGATGSHDSNGFLDDGPSFDYDFGALQGGMDIYRAEDSNGHRDHIGAYFALGTLSANVDHAPGVLNLPSFDAGSDRINGYTLGAYATRFWDNGTYLDAVLQGTWYDIAARSSQGIDLDTDGAGFAASLETGRPFRWQGGWFVEPQAQVVYQINSIDSANDGGANVDFGDIQALTGRLGARLGRTWTRDTRNGPMPVTAWFRPNVWYGFYNNDHTSFSSANGPIEFQSDLDGGWVDLNLGISLQTHPHASVYANANYDIGFDGDDQSWAGRIGFRTNW